MLYDYVFNKTKYQRQFASILEIEKQDTKEMKYNIRK